MPREWDTESVRSGGPKNYTVRRYKVPDRTERTTYEEDRYETDIKITNRGGEREQDFVYEREIDRRGGRNVREIKVVRERELDRAPSPPSPVREVYREPQRSRQYELDRYTRETEYIREPERIQPIIIRQEAPAPIIIRETAPAQQIVIREERREEPSYEMVESRSVAANQRPDDNRSVAGRSMVRREPSPQSEEEDYYYKRTTRQVARRYDDGRQDERDAYRRDLDPRDSASQYGDNRRDDRRDDRRRDDYSDDEYYYKKTTEEWGGDDKVDHRRHLAEGAALGLAGAALLKRNQRKNGKEVGGAGQYVGGAALGALGAEIVSRVRNRSQSRGRGGGRHDSEGPQLSTTAKVGALAVLGALAGYAVNKNRKDQADKSDNDRRSRSRVRKSSVSRSRGRSGSGSSDEGGSQSRGFTGDKATIAKAGLATAAIAGIVERVRSKSQGGRSRSVARQALPIAAAGLGGAALAGLYTQNKTKNGGRARGGGSDSDSGRSRARSKSRRRNKNKNKARARSRSAAPGGTAPSGHDQQNMVVYGGEPIPPAEQYARPRSRADSYYSNSGGRARGSPGSDGSVSPRSRSRNRNQRQEDQLNAHSSDEAKQRRQRKREERARRREEDDRNETPQGGWGPYGQPQPIASGQPNPYYPQTNAFPAPPPQQQTYSPQPVHNQSYYPPPTNAQEYNPYGATPTPAPQPGVTAATAQQWYPQADVQPTQPYPGHYNVSRASHFLNQTVVDNLREDTQSAPLTRPVGERWKSVTFALDPASSPAAQRAVVEPEVQENRGRRYDKSRYVPEPRRSHSADDAAPIRQPPPRRKANEVRRPRSPMSSASSDTIELPRRLDKQGTPRVRRGEDRLADALRDMLSGRGMAGEVFQRLTSLDIEGRRWRR